MITALLLMSSFSAPLQDPAINAPLTCAMLGGSAPIGGPAVDYKGVRYAFCCNMCQGGFMKAPDRAISADRNKGKTIGVALFDPVSDARISPAQAKAAADHNGVRYLFATADEKTTFNGDPAKYTAIPAKEALYCPVSKEKLSGYAAAGSYRDYNGVRYFFCCTSCPTDFDKKPDDYVKNAVAYVTDPKATIAPAEKVSAAKAGAGDAPPFTAMTFSCKHCGRSMTVNSPDDAKSTCSVCGCGKTMAECNPGQQK